MRQPAAKSVRSVAGLMRRQDSLAEQIFQDLRARLHRGEIRPDDRLVDVDIAGALGVSRMPVREALLRLTHEGYLVGTTRGFVPTRLTAEDIAEIFEVRALLEPEAAAQAASHLLPDRLAALTEARDRARNAYAAGDVEALMLANIAFRAVWLEATVNRRLAETISRFVGHVQVVRLSTLRRPSTQTIVIDGLCGLCDAFSARDAALARSRMTAFIGRAREEFEAAMAEADDESETQSQPRRTSA